MKYNVIVLGGGPAGYRLALNCAKKNLNVLIIEKEALGGTCLNKGCIPTKALLSLASATKPQSEIQSIKDQRVHQLRRGLESLIRSKKIQVIKGTGHIIGRKTVVAEGVKYQADNIVLATGSIPKILNVNGEHPHVITSDEALILERKPSDIAIIGGGVIGVEFAEYFNRLGAKVKIIEYMERLIPMAEPEVSQTLREAFEAKGIEVYTNAQANMLEANGVECIANGQHLFLEAETVMMATGREPLINGAKLFQHETIITADGFVQTDEQMATNVPGIYAIGDVTGKGMLAHSAYFQADIASEAIIGRCGLAFDPQRVPNCIYTTPEIAWVGMTEKEAVSSEQDIQVAVMDYQHNSRAVASGYEGFCKMIIHRQSRKVLGVHLVGAYATEIINQAVIMMKYNGTADDFSDMIVPHPTVSEILKETAEQF